MLLRGGGHRRDCENESDDDGRVAEREEEPDGDRPPPFLHQLAGDVVDRRDMVGVEGMPQPEAVSEEGRAKKKRIARETPRAPTARRRCWRRRGSHRGRHLAARPLRRVVKDVRKHAALRNPRR